ncbi:MAG: hypothetical protein LBI29_02560 [Rickettsiales bacterium]|nr:hypothetical protein [Rickettsiales bacterium]
MKKILVFVILLLSGCSTYYRDTRLYRARIASLEGKNTKVEGVVALLGEPDGKEQLPEIGEENWLYWSQLEGSFMKSRNTSDWAYTGSKEGDVLYILHIAKDKTVRSLARFVSSQIKSVKTVDRTEERGIHPDLLDFYRRQSQNSEKSPKDPKNRWESPTGRNQTSIEQILEPAAPVERVPTPLDEVKFYGAITLILFIAMRLIS